MEHKKALFHRFLTNTCSLEELNLLYEYFSVEDDDNLRMLIDKELNVELSIEESVSKSDFIETNRQLIKSRLDLIQVAKFSTRSIILKWGASIAALLAIVIGLYWYETKINTQHIIVQSENQTDVNPGGNTATLRLANGKILALRNVNEGVAVHADGQVEYSDGKILIQGDIPQQLVLQTPRAGQYRLMLPDGTKVWLNAETVLEYPNTFHGTDRRVKLVGEAYFEVVKDVNKPFVIESNKQEIRVLGTSFNVHAYPNERNVTTLLEGKLKVLPKEFNKEYILEPNQQTTIEDNNSYKSTVNAADYIAWKDGYFRFKASKIEDVLKQLERWYDLEIDYKDIPNGVRVHAVIRRDKKLTSVLYAIEEVTDLKFKLTGRRLELM